jgi:hypothetical protein
MKSCESDDKECSMAAQAFVDSVIREIIQPRREAAHGKPLFHRVARGKSLVATNRRSLRHLRRLCIDVQHEFPVAGTECESFYPLHSPLYFWLTHAPLLGERNHRHPHRCPLPSESVSQYGNNVFPFASHFERSEKSLFRPEGEICLRSLAFARDDNPKLRHCDTVTQGRGNKTGSRLTTSSA